ncbi:[protein-PII] uridylyltransferase [Crenobacter luteus]|uniref:Bifunctional uridylyltransferase/uridylyl-removing enzyme n=1 Tax=Crenobacter luteus TaxID=1452487 RepID=A0A163CCA7_9NEIS|nr:[protein-PII] uridylyltransferase [Crenobacter luteus]KZE31261.1 bifunctional uridylyltransferase/uridylyl-removing protein [Crenobacter luteus]
MPHALTDRRQALQTAREALFAAWPAHGDPARLLAELSRLVDEAIASLWQEAGGGDAAALLAVGGYGRGQLFPHSDIDLLILLPERAPRRTLELAEALIGKLWDLGLEVGHSVRTVDECLKEAEADITVATTLLERRLIAGDAALEAALSAALARELDPVAFVEGKQLEQQQRHNRYFGVTNNLEPNLKESPGGLRDLHTLLWISKATGFGDSWEALTEGGILTRAEARLIRQSERTLQKLRIDLHLVARRREDRLLFDFQQPLARLWGFEDTGARRASELLMHAYYRAARTVGQLNGVLLPNLRARFFSPLPRLTQSLDERFYTVNGMLSVYNSAIFHERPSAIFEAFLMLQRHPELTGFAPRSLRALWNARSRINERFRHDPANRALFMQIFREPGLTRTLRRMNLYGVLGKYLPAFGRIVGQMQHDLFHVYTVDEHILMVVRNLRRFAVPAFNHEYPFLSKLINDFDKPELLYLAGLFHDIAKGRGGDHSQLGRVDAREFCVAHGLSADDTELVVWLVQEHLTMSAIAQKEDIYDPETVGRFADKVATPRRLAALYLLTVADIRGTSPKVWNAWKAKLLEDLYHATQRQLLRGGELDLDSELEERKTQARALLRLFAVPAGVEDRLWAELDTVYFLRHEAKEIAWHARLLNRFVSTREPIVRARLSEDKEGVQVLVYTPDQPALFARLCAFFGRTRYSIADAKVYTTRHGYALDTFHVFIPEHHDGDYRDLINFIEFELAACLRKGGEIEMPPAGRVNRMLRHFPVAPQVLIRPDDRESYYVLSLVAGDQPGLLARITQILTRYGLSVQSAKIMTLGSRVEDSFLLSGAALSDDRALLALETELIEELKA